MQPSLQLLNMLIYQRLVVISSKVVKLQYIYLSIRNKHVYVRIDTARLIACNCNFATISLKSNYIKGFGGCTSFFRLQKASATLICKTG